MSSRGGLVLALGVVVAPLVACAVPCVDDGFLAMQHDAACQPVATTTTTGEGTTSGTTSGVTTSGVTTSGTTSEGTTSEATTMAGTSSGTSGGGTSTTGGGICGDGVVDPGEGCDDGAGNGDDKGCKKDCSAQVCGDGVVGPGEGCDDGNVQDGDGCSASCVSESCGDNKVDGGEACDDGKDGDQDDGCTDLCTLPACGDGFVQLNAGEACDLGVNNKNDGACTLDCTAAACGDGHVQAGVEACDDGVNNKDDAACTLACEVAVCGDGLVQAGVEACDDGNVVENDGCATDCTKAFQMALQNVRTCILLTSGMVRCWGSGAQGGLGQGNTMDLGDNPGEVPPSDLALGGVSVAISASKGGFCALRDTGVVRCWGRNELGQLGINTVATVGDGPGEMPPTDSKVGKSVVAIGGGAEPGGTMCAITSDGELRCWGSNSLGQLGLGNTNTLGDDPGELPSMATPVGFVPVQVSVGGLHICARSAAGKVRCWGDGSVGKLGNGGTSKLGDGPGELPVADIDLGGVAVELAIGINHTCARMDSGAVRCWGSNAFGQLGIGNTQHIGDQPGEMPPADVALGGTVTSIVGGAYHTCALRGDDSTVRCWGQNADGALGIGNSQNIGDGPGEMPPADTKIGGPALAVFGGVNTDSHCARMAGMNLRCWGKNNMGQLGLGHTNTIGDDELPSSAPFVPYQ